MAKSKEVTIYDIARKLNLSAATVSRGLKRDPSTAKKTMKRILDTAAEMGYRTNPFARNLISKRTNTIGVIIPGLASHFMSCVVEGIERVANQYGYNLLMAHSSDSSAKEGECVRSLFDIRADGLLVSLANDTTDLSHFDLFFKKAIPVIFFDRVFEEANGAKVLIDNRKAAYAATTHLVEQGCKRIVHVTTRSMQSTYLDRLDGYKQALSDHRLPFSENLVIFENLTMPGGELVANVLLSMRPRPDGVFVANDSCAIGCMQVLRQNGITIPDQIAFVGFNNDPASRIVEPNLTTINYSGHQVGETAARYLINNLDGDEACPDTNTIILRHELVVRASSQRGR